MASSVLTLLNRTSRSRSGIASSYSLRPGVKSRPGHKSLILWVSGISSGPSCIRTVLTSTVSLVSCSGLRCAILCNYQPVSIPCHTVLTSTVSPVSCSALRCAILCNYQPVSISCHTVLTSTVSPVSCSAQHCAIVCNYQPVSISCHTTHLHSFPNVLLSSALCSCGYWSASFRLAAWAHTIKAFIGRLTCILRLSDDALQHNIYSRVRNISLSSVLNMYKAHCAEKRRVLYAFAAFLRNRMRDILGGYFEDECKCIYYFSNVLVCQDRLCGLVIRVSGYRYRGPGFDSRRYQIFWVVVGLERGLLSLVRSTEELLE